MFRTGMGPSISHASVCLSCRLHPVASVVSRFDCFPIRWKLSGLCQIGSVGVVWGSFQGGFKRRFDSSPGLYCEQYLTCGENGHPPPKPTTSSTGGLVEPPR